MNQLRNYITKVKGYSERTADAYIKAIELFLKHHDYKTVTSKEIPNYLFSLNGVYMRNTTLAALNFFFKFKIRTGELKLNPMANVSYAKTVRKPVIPINEKEIATILERANFNSEQDYIFFETLYLSGMRINELSNLRPIDVRNSKDGAIKITGKGNKQRFVYLPEYAIKNLLSIIKDNKIGTYSYNTLRQKMSYYLKDFKKCKLTNTTKTSSHVLRHSSASNMLKSGANIFIVKEFLGHENCATTQHYTHLDMEFLKAQHQMLVNSHLKP